MAQISPAEAVRQFDVSKPTLYSDMNDGKLSYVLDDRKKRKIDVAELQRLYDIREKEEEKKPLMSVKEDSDLPKSNVKEHYVPESDVYKKEIELLKKEVEIRKEEADKWKEAFDKAQSTADKVTLLLEHDKDKSSSTEWERSIKSLETRISNQEKTAKDKEERGKRILHQNKALKKALEEEKSKGFWQKLFG